MLTRLKLIAALSLFAMASAAWALMPIRATVTIDGNDGHIVSEPCCAVKVPENERVLAIRRASNCRSGNLPVGRFDLAAGKLWLVALLGCQGTIPLQDVYPEWTSPVVASWLTGTFHLDIRESCPSDSSDICQRKKRVLILKHGVDVSDKGQANPVVERESTLR